MGIVPIHHGNRMNSCTSHAITKTPMNFFRTTQPTLVLNSYSGVAGNQVKPSMMSRISSTSKFNFFRRMRSSSQDVRKRLPLSKPQRYLVLSQDSLNTCLGHLVDMPSKRLDVWRNVIVRLIAGEYVFSDLVQNP